MIIMNSPFGAIKLQYKFPNMEKCSLSLFQIFANQEVMGVAGVCRLFPNWRATLNGNWAVTQSSSRFKVNYKLCFVFLPLIDCSYICE
jgi:hypothetical protein